MQHNDRMEELLAASIQIAEHMQEDGSTGEQLERIKQLLHEQMNMAASNGNVAVDKEFESKLIQVEQLVEGLERSAKEEYMNQTDANPAQFEANSIVEQREHQLAYHEKIDYLSLKKMKENLEQIRYKLQ